MNLYEKLNKLDDSLVESKRVIKKKKLTESSEKTTIEVKFEPYTRYGYEPVKTGRVSGKDLLDALLKMTDKMRLYIDSDYVDEYEEDYGVKLTAEALLERIEGENGDGCDFIYYIKNLTTGEMLFDSGYEESEDWDDDIDEMLTESTEQYELSTLVKDSINHLVNDLGKDSMADDFGDDVCADLENNYDIDVPQNPVKYADWCDAVMSEVSRQVNKNEEQLAESVDSSKAKVIRSESDADVVFYGYQYKNDSPVEIEPEELSYDEFESRKNQIVNSFTKLYKDTPKSNRHGKEHDIMFYALYKK